MKINNCKHEKEIPRWVKVENWMNGDVYEDLVIETESWLVDLDLHRYQCRVCKEIFYYSSRAEDYYTKGIKSEGIKGLE